MSSVTGVKITGCKTAPYPARKLVPPRKVCTAAVPEDKPQFWENVRTAVPMVCLSAAMTLSTGIAGASTLGPAYGGAVGGSDITRDVTEGVASKAADPGADLLNNLPTPSLPDPSEVGSSPPAKSVSGALGKTVSSVKSALDIGGENVSNVGPGVASNIQSVGQDLKDKAPPAIQSSLDNQARNREDALNKGKQEVSRVTGGSNPLESVKDFFSGGSPADSVKDAAEGARGALQSATGLTGNPVKDAKNALQGQNPLEDARGALQRSTSLTGNPIEDGKNALKGQNPINDVIQSSTGSNPLEGVKSFFSGGNPVTDNAPNMLKQSAENQARNRDDALNKGKQEVGRVAGGNPLESAKNALQRSTSGNPLEDARSALQSTTGLTGNPIEDGKNALKGQNPINDAVQSNISSNPLEGVKNLFSGGNSVTDNAPNVLKQSADNQARNRDDALNKGKQEVSRVSGGNPLEGVQNFFSGSNPADSVKDAAEDARDALQRNTGLTGNPVKDAKNALQGQNPLEDVRGALQRTTGLTGNPIEDGKNALKGQNPLEDARAALQRNTGLTGNPIEDGKNALQGQNPIEDAKQRSTGGFFSNFFKGGSADTVKGGADKLKQQFGTGVKNEFEVGNQNLQQNANTVKGAVNKVSGNEQKDLQEGLLKGVSFNFEGVSGNPLQQSVTDLQDVFRNDQGVGKAISQAQDKLTQGGPKTLGQAESKAARGVSSDPTQSSGFQNPFQGAGDAGRTISPNAGAKDAENLLKEGASSVQSAVQAGTNKLQRGVAFEQNENAARLASQPVSQESNDRSTNVISSARNLGDNVYRGVQDTVDDVRARTIAMERGESGVKGLADNVKANMQQAGQKAQESGKSIFGQ